METSRNKFTNFVCVLFSVSLAALFCFSIGIRFGIDNMVSRAIIAAIYCGIVVGLAFALNKIVNKSLEKGVSFDGDKVYKISLGIDIIAFILFRLLIIGDVIKIDFLKNSVFSMAKIGEDGSVFVDLSNIDNLFSTILSISFKIFGNTFLPVYLIQFIISGLTFAFVLLSVYKIFGRVSSAFTGFLIAVTPVFFRNIASSGSDNLIILLFSIILLLTAKYKDVIEVKSINVLLSFGIGLFTGICALYSSLLILALLIPIFVLWDCRCEYIKDRVINTFVIVVGHIICFSSGLLLEAYLFSDDGVLAFVDSLINHIKFRFVFSFKPSYIEAISEDTSVFLLFVIAIIYCVIYWKNDNDSAHIISLTTVLFVIQLCGLGINNFYAASMLIALFLMIIGGCGISNLGYTDTVRIYKIEDDMQPAVIASINDKPVAEEIKIVEEEVISAESHTENKENVILAEEKNLTDISNDEKVLVNNAIEDSINTFEDNNTVVSKQFKDTNMVEDSTLDDSSAVLSDIEESRYSKPEVRKTSDYGINNADFESLFSGTSNLPKFVYNDLYSVDLEEDNIETLDSDNDINENSDEVIDDSEIIVSEESANVNDTVLSDDSDSDDMNMDNKDDSKDKKAYVDSFFGYLYSEEGKFEAFEPIKPLDDIPEIIDKEPVIEEYVSHADKFADLDLDLGVDAFDNINVSDNSSVEETQALVETNEMEENVSVVEANDDEETESVLESNDVEETESVVEENDVDETESVVEENDTVEFKSVVEVNEAEEVGSLVNINDVNSTENNFIKEEEYFFDEDEFSVEESNIIEEMIQIDSFAIDVDDEPSLEEMLEKKIDEDFSYEEALNKKIADEEIEKAIGFSFEQALEKKIDVEESINNALLKNDFSFEEALNDKIIAEEAVEEAVMDDNISVVHTLSNKIKLDDILEDNSGIDGFSIQEAIETKIDVEKSIENATNEKILEEFGDDNLFDGVVIDFSGETNGYDETLLKSDSSLNEYEEIHVMQASDEMQAGDEIHEPSNNEILEEDDKGKDDLINMENNKSDDIVNEDIKFIDNPLPLPKKHVHREMDYGRVIPSAWMHYDVEIDQTNNHYDI